MTGLDMLEQFADGVCYPSLEFLGRFIERSFFESDSVGLAPHAIKTLYSLTQMSFHHLRRIALLDHHGRADDSHVPVSEDHDLFEAILDTLVSCNRTCVQQVSASRMSSPPTARPEPLSNLNIGNHVVANRLPFSFTRSR
jgi:hypothetical protein